MELPKVKKKRSDVSKRIEGNKDTDFVCIKMSWNSLCKNNYLKQGIQEIVYNINKISFLSSKNILLLLQCEKQGKRRPKCFREQKE
jgi:hypothetical protein